MLIVYVDYASRMEKYITYQKYVLNVYTRYNQEFCWSVEY